MAAALEGILQAAGSEPIVILLDGNVPCEEMVAAASVCEPWSQAKLCFVTAQAEEQLLLGTEASGADYLSPADLAECDGFILIGDAFAANPLCAGPVLDRRKGRPKTPIVAIDPAAGSATKFASHRLQTPLGAELSVLSALAAAAGADVEGMAEVTDVDGAASAGSALAACERVGVLVAAEYGRGTQWQCLGYLAGQLGRALHGGVAPQTSGANALATVRLGQSMGTISLAQALSSAAGIRIAVGCDVLGMLGWAEPCVDAAAAALPNCTTELAQFVLPVAMTGELAGTYLLDCGRQERVAPLLAPPAGVPTPAELIAMLASLAGVGSAGTAGSTLNLGRLAGGEPESEPMLADPPGAMLLLSREASHAGCGDLTGHGSWQCGADEIPNVQVSAGVAARLKLSDLALVNVCAGDRSLRARLQIAPELTGDTVVAPESLASARALMPAQIDPDRNTVAAVPASVEVSV